MGWPAFPPHHILSALSYNLSPHNSYLSPHNYMKHRIIILLLLLALPLAGLAQKSYNIGRVFDGRYRKNPNVTDVVVRSPHLQTPYINYYHSITVTGDTKIMDDIVQAFLADEKNAAEKEMQRVGGHIYYGFYRLRNDDTNHPFVFLKDMRYAPSGRKSQLTIIYMLGECTTADIKRTFKK